MEFLGIDFTCLLLSLQMLQIPPLHTCLLPLLSKAVGYAIVAASTIVKAPQV
jgi:mannose-P-dolichol utilization defect protein 1